MFPYLPLCAIIVIALPIAARVVTLARRGVRAIIIRQQSSASEQAFEGVAFALLVSWTYLLAVYADGHGPRWLPASLDRQLYSEPLLQWLGALLLAAGAATFALAIRAMGASFRMGIEEVDESQAPSSPAPLVTHGIFAWSRNPIYVAFDLITLGSVLIHGRTVIVIVAAALAAAFHIQIVREERFLAEVHGDDYTDYRKQVRRYI